MSRIRWGLFYVTIGLVGATSLWVRFRHPTLTETQLFTEFWYVWLLSVVAIGAAYLGMPRR